MKKRIKIKPMFAITDYNPIKYEKENLRKWCIEQAASLKSTSLKSNSNEGDTVIKTAQKIYDWVKK